MRNSFFSAMFVNVGDNHSVIDRVKLTYNYDEIDDLPVSFVTKYGISFFFNGFYFWLKLA